MSTHPLTTPHPFRLGILGLGEGVSILSAAVQSPLAEPYLLCDLNEDLCRQRAAAFGLNRYTTDYHAMLADTLVDAVAIYTPDPLHREHVAAALAAGKHVICTKPLFKGLAGARAVRDLWKSSGKAVLVGMSCRFFETFLHQTRWAREGKHGLLRSVEAHYNGDKRGGTSGAWGKRGAVDWLYTGLVHPVDLVYQHLGPIREVCGFATRSAAADRQGQSPPDTFHFALVAENGAVGRVTGCYGSPGEHSDGAPMIACTLRGDTGVSQANYPQFRLTGQFDGEPSLALNFDHRHAYYFRWGGAMHHAGEFQNYLEHFVTAIRDGTRVAPDLDDGLRVIAILEAMQRSLAERRVVTVREELALHGLEELAWPEPPPC
jgi:predicted dehydrogenase